MRPLTISPPLKAPPVVQYVFPRFTADNHLAIDFHEEERQATCRDVPIAKQVVAIRDLLVAVIVGALLLGIGAAGGFWAGSQHKPAPMPEMNLVLQPGDSKPR